jgi:hypothetical protein
VNAVYPPVAFQAVGGLAPLVWSESGAMGGLTLGLDGTLSGTAVTTGHFPITVSVRDALNRLSPGVPFTVRVSLARSGIFTASGSLQTARFAHAAILLDDGRVLVTGGTGMGAPYVTLASAELYDPGSATFAPTAGMLSARSGHVMTLLGSPASGTRKVLLLGGDAAGTTAELFDPATGTFAATGSLETPRRLPTATPLANGKVLVAGGGSSVAELYDPATGAFATTGSLAVARSGHSATLLADGRVLVAGGGTSSAELYDPARGSFAPTGAMTMSRTGHSAVRLQDGTVLVAGSNTSTTQDFSADLYDPASGTFSPVGAMIGASAGSSFSLLSDGSVLAAGGSTLGQFCLGRCQPDRVATASAAHFGPESLGFTASASMAAARERHTATTLPDGSVLIVGGDTGSVFSRALNSSEVFRQ